MPIRVHNFAGVLGWNARKYLPGLSTESYLKLQFLTRRKQQKKKKRQRQKRRKETMLHMKKAKDTGVLLLHHVLWKYMNLIL